MDNLISDAERWAEELYRRDPKGFKRERSKAFRTLKQPDDLRKAVIELMRLWAAQEDNCDRVDWPAAPRILAPWGVLWSGEDRYEVRPCKWVGSRRAIWQPHDPGKGKPIFNGKHAVRDRRSAVERLCSVCGEKLRPGLQYIDLSGWPDPDGEWFNLTNTPFHPECAEASIHHCPFVAASLKRFAPYNGATNLGIYSLGSDRIEELYGLHVQPGTFVVDVVKVQIPISEFDRLNAMSAHLFGPRDNPD